MSETINAKIASTSFGIEDRGILTFYLHLEWSWGGQGLGGYTLDSYDRATDSRIGWGAGLDAMRKIMETVGVEKWEDLKGKLVRAKIEGAGSARPPIIGNILEDKWFDLKAFMESKGAQK